MRHGLRTSCPRSRAGGKHRADPELHGFRSQAAASSSFESDVRPVSVPADSENCLDPSATPRPEGPPEADEEQEYAAAREMFGWSQQSEQFVAPASPLAPPPPIPVALTDDIRARIAANREAAKARRSAKAAEEKRRRLKEVAPWNVDPKFGLSLFDRAVL